jgi:hypothetical protein
VLASERLAQQRVVEQVGLSRRQIIGDAPIYINGLEIVFGSDATVKPG